MQVDPKFREPAAGPGPAVYRSGPVDKVRQAFKRHGKKLWWLHSVYALGLGATVVMFAQKGFDHSRWLAVTVGAAWLLVVLFFRLFGSGMRQENVDHAAPKAKLRFYAMTYALKNLYQGMLFFLLPFYWKSTTLDALNVWFVCLLAVCAILSTLDIVFDRVLMKFRALASMFHGVILFGCLNLVIPALFPDTRTLWTLLWAAGVTVVSFWTLHVSLNALKQKRYMALFVVSVVAGVALAYFGREGIAPVPMHLSRSAVGPSLLDDGRLAMEVKSLHTSVITQLLAVTDVVVPGGKGDRLQHVWRHNGVQVHRASEDITRVDGPQGTVRLRSKVAKEQLPAVLTGRWTIDVETEDGQLVGRTSFTVTE